MQIRISSTLVHKVINRIFILKLIFKMFSYISFWKNIRFKHYSAAEIQSTDDVIMKNTSLLKRFDLFELKIIHLVQKQNGLNCFAIERAFDISNGQFFFKLLSLCDCQDIKNVVFYYNCGYGNRYLALNNLTPKKLVKVLNQANFFGMYYGYIENGKRIFGINYSIRFYLYNRVEESSLCNNYQNKEIDVIDFKYVFGQNRRYYQACGQYSQIFETVTLQSQPCERKVDLVYTWVNSDDVNWSASKADCVEALTASYVVSDGNQTNRFKNRDELLYSLRSVERYANFINKIYIVTDNQVPKWLDINHPKIHIVDHRDIFESSDDLPTFNSHAIEANLHRIKGLSEYYLYLNDDFMFLNHVNFFDFYTRNYEAKQFPSEVAFIPLSDNVHDLSSVDVAAYNGQSFLRDKYGFITKRKFKHAPYSQLKSVIGQFESENKELFNTVSSSRLRGKGDFSLSSSLFLHFYKFSKVGVTAKISYLYITTADKWFGVKAFKLLKCSIDNRPKCLCINDTTESEVVSDKAVSDLLNNLYPYKSSFEK